MGERIDGRYEVLKQIGSGALSVVFKAVDLRTDRPLAIKFINVDQTDDALFKRIQREIEILSALFHPNVVTFYGSGALPDGHVYLLLEWLDGADLSDFKSRARMPLRHVLELAAQVADALSAAHDIGIIHRDIKPANIFLLDRKAGAGPDCRVLDFGVAKIEQATAEITRAGAILGTPTYMAPEQATYAMNVDARADIFSLGVVTFELLTGRLPWETTSDIARLSRILVERGRSVQDVSPEVPRRVAELIDRMLALDCEERISTAREVHDRLRDFLSRFPSSVLDKTFGLPVHLPRPAREPKRTPSRRRLFGRVEEIASLRISVSEAIRSREATRILVTGVAGIGKTSVSRELEKSLLATSSSFAIFSRRAEGSARSTPHAFVRRVIFAEASVRPEDPLEVKQRKLVEILPADVRSEVTSFLGEALAVPFPTHPRLAAARGDPRGMREQIRRALCFVLGCIIERNNGLVIIVDDAHFLDGESAAVFTELSQPERRLPLVLVLVSQPNILEHEAKISSLAGEGARVIHLPALDSETSRDLVRGLIDRAIESSVLDHLVQRAGGNPLFLEQIVLAVRESGLFEVNGSGEYVLRGPGPSATPFERVPPTVAAAVQVRISSLDPEARRVLAAAAVLGDIFWAEGVARILERTVESVTEQLDLLRGRGFVRTIVEAGSSNRPGSEMEFVHAVVRSVALSRLKRRRRHRYERGLAAYLNALGGECDETLALHAAQAGDPARASMLYANAAERALSVGALADALSMADEGLALTDGLTQEKPTRLRLLNSIERAAELLGDLDRAEETMEEIRSLSASDEDLARWFERKAQLAFLRRRFVEAAECAQNAKDARLRLASTGGRANAELLFAEASEAMGDGSDALRGFIGALRIFVVSHDSRGVGRASRGLGRIAIASGEYRTAENRLVESLQEARRTADGRASLESLILLADVARLTGRQREGLEHLGEADLLALDTEAELLLQLHRARLDAETLPIDRDAQAQLERVVTEASRGGVSLEGVFRLAALCAGQLFAINPDTQGRSLVQGQLEQALASAEIAEPTLKIALESALSFVLAREGHLARAREVDVRVIREFMRSGAVVQDEPPRILFVHARVLEISGGAKEKVRSALREAVEHLDTIASRLDRAMRKGYLERALARTILLHAERLGLRVSRQRDSNRIELTEA